MSYDVVVTDDYTIKQKSVEKFNGNENRLNSFMGIVTYIIVNHILNTNDILISLKKYIRKKGNPIVYYQKHILFNCIREFYNEDTVNYKTDYDTFFKRIRNGFPFYIHKLDVYWRDE